MWRIYKGKPRESASYSKTVLRCALNKSYGVEEMKQMHGEEGNSPYHVFRFRSPGKMFLASLLSFSDIALSDNIDKNPAW